ncbi:uncharacterized protein J4E88_007370 [Alternaria novae-zelandiae]|uniref:uncharacterized protein n=1 Tax=Alternaria novae-zelandiae TaxID=430562 RepID=UPI0020C32A33|nr:uncharacterized protein J4E88_007370 [Alternaria novae-zelandiae]KAI4676452.1 hypothetical protein J4E88_007370 [Alternaria novae-zelandiae]
MSSHTGTFNAPATRASRYVDPDVHEELVLAFADLEVRNEELERNYDDLEYAYEQTKALVELAPDDSDATEMPPNYNKINNDPSNDDWYGPCIEAQAKVQALEAEVAKLKHKNFSLECQVERLGGEVESSDEVPVTPAAETTFPDDEPLDEAIVTSASETASPADEPSDETVVTPEADPAPADDEPRGHKRTLSQSEVASTENVESKKARPAFWSGDLTRRPKKNPKRRQAQTQV